MSKNVKKAVGQEEFLEKAVDEKEEKLTSVISSPEYQALAQEVAQDDDAKKILDEIEDLKRKSAYRAHAYAVRAQILDMLRAMEGDPNSMLAVLMTKHTELAKETSVAVTVGGVEIPPLKNRSEIYAIEKRIKAYKNSIGEKIAAREGLVQDEIFALYNSEHPSTNSTKKELKHD